MNSAECKEIYDRLEDMVENLAYYAGTNNALSRYYIPQMQREKARNEKELERALTKSIELSPKELMIQFARSLQNSGQMINSIKFDDRRKTIGKIICDFNPEKLLNEYESADALYSKIYTKYYDQGWTRAKDERKKKERHPTNLRKYAEGLYSAAKFLLKKNNVRRINDAITFSYQGPWDSEKDSRVTEVIESMRNQKRERIKYLGEALSYDFLKECGCLYLAKPDTHLNKVVDKLIVLPTETDHDKQLKASSTTRAVANFTASLQENGGSYAEVTPYKIDKMIWLICTGNFYLEGKSEEHESRGAGVHSHRDILIRYLNKTGAV